MSHDDWIWAIAMIVTGVFIILIVAFVSGCVSVEVTHYTTVIAMDNETTVEAEYERENTDR